MKNGVQALSYDEIGRLSKQNLTPRDFLARRTLARATVIESPTTSPRASRDDFDELLLAE